MDRIRLADENDPEGGPEGGPERVSARPQCVTAMDASQMYIVTCATLHSQCVVVPHAMPAPNATYGDGYGGGRLVLLNGCPLCHTHLLFTEERWN